MTLITNRTLVTFLVGKDELVCDHLERLVDDNVALVVVVVFQVDRAVLFVELQFGLTCRDRTIGFTDKDGEEEVDRKIRSF